MKIPLSLIRSYLDLNEPLPVIAEALTLLGIEVDGIQSETPRFAHIIAADVRSVQPHPAADKLQIAQVTDGEKEWQVVCGAKNCRAGLKVAFAKAGVGILYDEHGKESRIEAAEIRKVPSSGMLCSADELGIPGEAEGIIELPSSLKAGQDLTSFLWDPVLELSLTPNLGHCMSALGVARELSAALQKPLKKQSHTLRETAHALDINVSVQDPHLCSRYLCRLITGVKVGPSPFWLQQTLLAAGYRPINNVVDATNYILLKTGQPLHAFDAERIEGKRIVVKTLEKPEPFTGLDAIEREIPAGSLVIADGKKTVALAGILGGENSSVSEHTHSILLEAACFDGLSIRKTARHAGLRTESSQRFEKGIDWQNIPNALHEACQLIAELAGGQIAKGEVDVHTSQPKLREIDIRPLRTNQLLGTKLSLGEIEELLHRIDCKTQEKGADKLRVTIPSFRNDLLEEIDLVEEIARIYGYNNIEKKAPLYTSTFLPHDPQFLFERLVRSRMTGQGLQEILTCDLISPKLAEISPEFLLKSSPLHVMHAKSEEYSVLRPSLLPGVLEVVRFNLDQKNNSLSAFEIGRIHVKQDSAPREIPMLALVLTGKNAPSHWEKKTEEVDFFDLKGMLESLFEALGVSSLSFIPSSHISFHPGRQADLTTESHRIGTLGEIHPHVLAKLDIKQRVLFAEINLEDLLKLHKSHVRMAPLPSFPATERDWTLPLPNGVQAGLLLQAARSFQSPLLEKVELTSLYAFEQDGQSKRNATLRFVYRDPVKTISFEEAEAVHAKLIAHIAQEIQKSSFY